MKNYPMTKNDLHSTYDYNKMILEQANQVSGRLEKDKNNQKVKTKVKSLRLNRK